MNNQKLSNEVTRENYKNEKFCNVSVTTNKNNEECLVFHNEIGCIQSDTVKVLKDMR